MNTKSLLFTQLGNSPGWNHGGCGDVSLVGMDRKRFFVCKHSVKLLPAALGKPSILLSALPMHMHRDAVVPQTPHPTRMLGKLDSNTHKDEAASHIPAASL